MLTLLLKLKQKCKCKPFLVHRKGGCLISPGFRIILRNMIQYGLLLFLVTLLSIWIGAEVQDHKARKEAETIYLYQGSQVCGMEYPPQLLSTIYSKNDDNNSTTNEIVELYSTSTTKDNDYYDNDIVIDTFPSKEAADSQDNVTIAHCGDCGACSNPHDIAIYDETKETLFEDSFVCSKRGLLAGRRTATKCLKEAVGLSDACNDCWVENIMCDLKYCIFTCMWHAIFSEVNSDSSDPQALNRCTECDEKRCGPAFVKCAGANRRRSGILSEFDRDLNREVCKAVDSGWWLDTDVQQYWDHQQERSKNNKSNSSPVTHTRQLR